MDEEAVLEHRRFRRYDLKLPVELIRAGSHRLSRRGKTRNLSSGGVLFKLHCQLELGDPIEYFITLPPGPERDVVVRMVCRGRVVRLERPRADVATASGKPIAVAATLERHEFIRHAYRSGRSGQDVAGPAPQNQSGRPSPQVAPAFGSGLR